MYGAMSATTEAVVGRATIARSAAWRAFELVGAEVMAFIFALVLARLLTPTDYGIIAIAGFFVATGHAIVMRGLPDALVQRQDVSISHMDAAFWANIGIGTLAAGLLVAMAEPFARLSGKPQLAQVLPALAPLLVVFAASGIYLAALRRRMHYRAIALRSIVSVLVAGSVGVWLAFHGANYWSLVGQQVTHAILGIAAFALFGSWYPRFRFSRAQLRDVLSFGLPISGSSLATSLAHNTSIIILGFFLMAAEMGSYFLAYRLFSSLALFTYWSVAELSLPVLSRLQHDPAGHREAATNALRITGIVCLPSFIALALMAEPVLHLLVGPKWGGSVLPLQVLAAFGIFQALQAVAGQILVSAGKAKWQLRLTLASGLLSVLCLLPVAQFGLVPSLIAIGVAAVAMAPAVLWALEHGVGLSRRRVLREQLPAVGATLAMAAAMLVAARFIATESNLLAVAVPVLAGGVAYVAVIGWLMPDLTRQLGRLLNKAMARRSPAA